MYNIVYKTDKFLNGATNVSDRLIVRAYSRHRRSQQSGMSAMDVEGWWATTRMGIKNYSECNEIQNLQTIKAYLERSQDAGM